MATGPIDLHHAVCGLSAALDLVSKDLVRHHAQATTLAGFLGSALGLSADERAHLQVAAALHDIGAIALNRTGELFSEEQGSNHHAEVGAVLLRTFEPFEVAAEIVRHHHVPWVGRFIPAGGERIHLMAQILHLADRVAIRIRPDPFVLAQVDAIVEGVVKTRAREFAPEVVDAFTAEARRDVFWLETVNASFPLPGLAGHPAAPAKAGDPALRQLSELFRMVIDFRSSHTATHSRAVAAVAEQLAGLIGFSATARAMIHVAGNLHDLGKLAVPAAILDKPGKLDAAERAIIRSHPYYTGKVLERIAGFDEIAQWAALHHEHHDGTGYPWRVGADRIPLGARIVALADAFSALAEPRSYRPALARPAILAALREMTAQRKLDPFLLQVLEDNLELLDRARLDAIAHSEREFARLRAAAAEIYAFTPAPGRDLWAALAC